MQLITAPNLGVLQQPSWPRELAFDFD